MVYLSYFPLYSNIPSMLMRNRWIRHLSASEIRSLQNKKLRALIKHSYNHVPYYHNLFKKVKLRPNDIKTVDDLVKIPISKKTDMRDIPIEHLIADNINIHNCWVQKTSGTSGIPFSIYKEKNVRTYGKLRHYLYQLDCGDRITNKRVVIGGAWMHLPPSIIQKIGVFRTKKISPLSSPKIQLQEIAKFNARTLIAPPSCMVAVAKELESDYIRINLSFLFTAGELLNDHLRYFLEETFGANLFNHYGATEGGVISRECREHRFHIESETVFIETTRDGMPVAPNKEGDVTLTNLESYVQPFIRYNLEDLGTLIPDDCVCGSQFPLMQLTSGRVSNLIHLPDGTALSAHEVNWFLTVMPAIKQYQVIQEKIDQLKIKLVKGHRFDEKIIPEILQTFHKRLGSDMRIHFSVVDHIPREKSGKFKLFKTNISS